MTKTSVFCIRRLFFCLRGFYEKYSHSKNRNAHCKIFDFGCHLLHRCRNTRRTRHCFLFPAFCTLVHAELCFHDNEKRSSADNRHSNRRFVRPDFSCSKRTQPHSIIYRPAFDGITTWTFCLFELRFSCCYSDNVSSMDNSFNQKKACKLFFLRCFFKRRSCPHRRPKYLSFYMESFSGHNAGHFHWCRSQLFFTAKAQT